MSVETLLFLIESLLLAVTVILILFSIKEGRGRRDLLLEVEKAGAQVRYSSCPVVHNIRYIVVDERLVVFGIPESTGEKEATRKGYRIPSEGLASILREFFYKCWEKDVSYDEYLKEVVKQTGAPSKILARELQIDEGEIERVTAG